MKTYIYTLEHPITNEIRYVGKTNSPERRLHHHWTVGYKSNNKTGNWLKSLKKLNLKPLMINNHPNKKPVLCYDKNGLLIRKFESIRDGSKFYKISEHAICNNLIGRSKSCNNLIWKYA